MFLRSFIGGKKNGRQDYLFSFCFFAFCALSFNVAALASLAAIFCLSNWCIIAFIKQPNLRSKIDHNGCNHKLQDWIIPSRPYLIWCCCKILKAPWSNSDEALHQKIYIPSYYIDVLLVGIRPWFYHLMQYQWAFPSSKASNSLASAWWDEFLEELIMPHALMKEALSWDNIE